MGKADDLEKSAAQKQANGDHAGASQDFERAAEERRGEGALDRAATDYQHAVLANLAAGRTQQASDDAAAAGDALRDLANTESGRDAALDYGKATLLYEDAGALDAALAAGKAAADAWKADAAAHEADARGLRSLAELDRQIARRYDDYSDPKKGNPNAAAFDEKAALWFDQSRLREEQARAELELAAKSRANAASVINSLARIEGMIAHADKAQQADINARAKKDADKESAKEAAAKEAAKRADDAAKDDARRAARERKEAAAE